MKVARNYRTRIAIWSGAVLVAILVLLGTVLYFGLRHFLFDQYQEHAETQATILLSEVSSNRGTLTWNQKAFDDFQEDDNFIRLFDADLQLLIDTSEMAGGSELNETAVHQGLDGEQSFAILHDSPETMGVFTLPIVENGETTGVLQVGVSRGDADEVLRYLRYLLAACIPAAALLAAIAGYLVAGKAIAPVKSMTELARSIQGNDLQARLNLDLPDDELGQLASTFDQMLDRIELAFERQKSFTADAAHELRTPLAILKSQLESLRDSAEESDSAAWLRAETEVARLQRIIASLLSLARIDRGELTLHKSRFDLARPISLVAEEFGDSAREHGLLITTDARERMVTADEDLITQALVNLVENAIRNTSPGGTVHIGCNSVERTARVWVEDNGVGIPAEAHQRIFERFARIDSGRGIEHGGAGLGLAICDEIVAAHGGRIEVESEPGRGSKFTIVISDSPEVHPGDIGSNQTRVSG